MKDILKPIVALALGVVIGAVGFWLAAKPDVTITGSLNDFPDVKGISGATFAGLDKPVISDVRISVGLDGYIATITDKVILLGSLDSQEQVSVVVDDSTVISGVSSESGQPQELKLADLKPGDTVNVIASIKGSALVAQSISRIQ